MLEELRVANLGIIGEAAWEPGPGFIAITGETGAGKTLLLGALRLLLGSAAKRDQVGPLGEEAKVEGRFLRNGTEIVVARRVVGSGRSRAYVDGDMVPAKTLESRTAGLVEIVGQHDHLVVTRADGIRRLLDAALDPAGVAADAAYREAWERLQTLEADLQALGGDRRALEREVEVARFQVDEIASAEFATGDDALLTIRAGRLRSAEGIAEHLGGAAEAAAGERSAGELLGLVFDELTRAARLDPSLERVVNLAHDAVTLTADLATEISRVAEDLEHEPEELEEVERRLALLGDLRRKYGETLADVLDYGEAATTRIVHIERLLERAESLESELKTARAAVEEAGVALSQARSHAAERITHATVRHLTELGFTNPVVHLDVIATDPGPNGTDRIELNFASDASLPPGPVGRVASGGELSRLVLALRLASGVGEASVIAFDEVDSGIGGETALAMGTKLAALASGRQVLCVTHLPQVAAFADRQLVVERTGATAAVREVSGEDRLRELSRMLSGLPESERGRRHAAELLEMTGWNR
jgi:DNA repair protein RecN (Recombination protein N)